MKRLTEHFDKMTEAERRVCQYIYSNPSDVSTMNINHLAKKSFTSKTVVITAAQKMGFEGFSNLKYFLQEQNKPEPKQETSFIQELNELVSMTSQIVKKDQLETLATLLLDANMIYIAGRGTSMTCATHLNHLLTTNNVTSITVEDANLLSIISQNVTEKDVFIYISLSGETAMIVDSCKSVKAKGATTIALTSFTNNPLMQLSDHSFYVATHSVDTQHDDDISRIGFFALIEIIANAVKMRK